MDDILANISRNKYKIIKYQTIKLDDYLNYVMYSDKLDAGYMTIKDCFFKSKDSKDVKNSIETVGSFLFELNQALTVFETASEAIKNEIEELNKTKGSLLKNQSANEVYIARKRLDNINDIEPIVNTQAAGADMPFGGLLATTEDALIEEHGVSKRVIKEKCLRFTLSDTARIIRIRSTDDLAKLPKYKLAPFLLDNIDFEKIAEQYDVIDVKFTDYNVDNYLDSLRFELGSWPDNSILVLNPQVIEIIK